MVKGKRRAAAVDERTFSPDSTLEYELTLQWILIECQKHMLTDRKPADVMMSLWLK